MKPLTLRSLSTSQKQNTNHLNQILSPQPTGLIKPSNQRKVFISSTTPQQFCQNQDGRKATHTVSQAHQSFNYCQKCSIIAASKGFPVQKISDKPQNITQKSSSKALLSNTKVLSSRNKHNTVNFRLNTVNQLKQEISQSEQQLETKFEQVQELLMESGDKYTHLIEQTNSYFQVIEQMVQYQKYLAYNKILTERVEKEKDVRQFKNYIQNAIEQLKRINQDLNQNQDIVLTVGEEQFDFIMKGYQLTVSHIPDILSVNPEIQVFDSIRFPQLWKNLDQLADSIQLQHQSFLTSQNLLLSSNQKTNLIMSALDLQNCSDNLERLLEADVSEKQSYPQNHQNYDNSSETVSQHSFSNNSAFMRGNRQLHPQIIKTCSKEIFLQNAFSLASSIADNEQQSSEEDEQQFSQALNRNFKCKTNLFKNYQQTQKIDQFEESLGQYFVTEETLPMNQTLNQKSQTFLLNH